SLASRFADEVFDPAWDERFQTDAGTGELPLQDVGADVAGFALQTFEKDRYGSLIDFDIERIHVLNLLEMICGERKQSLSSSVQDFIRWRCVPFQHVMKQNQALAILLGNPETGEIFSQDVERLIDDRLRACLGQRVVLEAAQEHASLQVRQLMIVRIQKL